MAATLIEHLTSSAQSAQLRIFRRKIFIKSESFSRNIPTFLCRLIFILEKQFSSRPSAHLKFFPLLPSGGSIKVTPMHTTMEIASCGTNRFLKLFVKKTKSIRNHQRSRSIRSNAAVTLACWSRLCNRPNSTADSLCALHPLEDISFYHYCCLRFFLSFFIHFQHRHSDEAQQQKHSFLPSLHASIRSASLFFRSDFKIMFVAHSQSSQLYSRVIKANNDARVSGWDLTVSESSPPSFTCNYNEAEGEGRESKGALSFPPTQVDVIQFTIRMMFQLPSPPIRSTSNHFFHSRKDIQTTFYPSAENAHHKCNYECSPLLTPATRLLSSIPQFTSSPLNKKRKKIHFPIRAPLIKQLFVPHTTRQLRCWAELTFLLTHRRASLFWPIIIHLPF